MTSGPNLAQLLGVEIETVEILAETAEDAGRLAMANGSESLRIPDNGAQYRPALHGPQLRLAALTPSARPYLRAATLLTTAASNWLVLGEISRAKRCFADAADQVAQLNGDDAFILRLCSDPSTDGWNFDDVSAPSDEISPWAQALGQAVDLARGRPVGQIHNWVGVAASSMPLCGLHAWDFENVTELMARALDHAPVLADQQLVRLELADQDEEFAEPRVSADEAVDLLLLRAARPLEPIVETPWWRLQMGSILPLEPELVAVALIGAAWHGREGKTFVPELSPPARAAFIAASQLLG